MNILLKFAIILSIFIPISASAQYSSYLWVGTSTTSAAEKYTSARMGQAVVARMDYKRVGKQQDIYIHMYYIPQSLKLTWLPGECSQPTLGHVVCNGYRLDMGKSHTFYATFKPKRRIRTTIKSSISLKNNRVGTGNSVVTVNII